MDGRQKGFGVHKLVAMAYIPNPNNYPIVMHLDSRRTHNVVSNLMWGTPKMNMAQMAKDGRSTRKYKFSKRQYRRLVRLKRAGLDVTKVGREVWCFIFGGLSGVKVELFWRVVITLHEERFWCGTKCGVR